MKLELEIYKKIIFEEFEEAKKMILSQEVSLNLPCWGDKNILGAAIEADSPNMVQFVIEQGGNPNFMTDKLAHPLHLAMEMALEAFDYGPPREKVSVEVLQKLIEGGADVHLVCLVNKQTPYNTSQKYCIEIRKFFEQHK